MSDTFVLIAATRNEGPFLLEWVAYHRAIGFTDILLFCDEDVDGGTDLARALAEAGLVELHTNEGPGGRRNRAYERAMRLPKVQTADYVMPLDIDEFVNIHAGDGTLPALLEATKSPDAISLGWRLFGQGGVTGFEDLPVIERLTWAAPLNVPVSERQFAVKTLFRPGFAASTGPHRPTPMDNRTEKNTRWVNGSGRSVSSLLMSGGWKLSASTTGFSLAQVNHYPIRSSAIFALHHFSTPPLGPEAAPFGLGDFFAFNHNHERDVSIRRHVPRLRAEMARLMNIPAVAKAHLATVETTRKLLQELLSGAALNAQSPVAQIMDQPTSNRVMRVQQAEAEELEPPRPAGDAVEEALPAEGRVTVEETELAPRWLADLRRCDHRRGWYSSERSFAAQFTLRSRDTLIVSFDNLSTTRDPSLARETWGYPFYAKEGFSHMGVMAFERNWYRDEALFNFMEGKRRLFAAFKQVVFTGTSMGAYAATAFADLAPGSTVLAYSPQATLDPARVPWEERFHSGRKQDWSGRYSFGPDHCRRARDVFILYDPYFEPDRRHAELYQGPNVRHLKCWYASHKSALFLRRAEVLKEITLEAIAGTLTSQRYYELYRARRNLPWYLNGLADHVIDRNHPDLARGLSAYLSGAQFPSVAQSILRRLDVAQAS